MIVFLDASKNLKQANKHNRTLLDFLREETDIPFSMLNELIPKIVGRNVKDFRYLSAGENKMVREYINDHYAPLAKTGRKRKGWDGTSLRGVEEL
jgi:hypothetical protein